MGRPIEAETANLARKRNLKELHLSWVRNGEAESQKDVEKILKALEPPPSITILKITNYKGSSFPNWMSNTMLENVVHVTLINCTNCLKLPTLKKLPSLKSLGIQGMDFVQFLVNESCDGELVRGFMRLESLCIIALPNLERLSREEGRDIFPCLSKIRIVDCPKLSLPCLPSVRKLEVT